VHVDEQPVIASWLYVVPDEREFADELARDRLALREPECRRARTGLLS
jgi:hypothetical protein